MNITLSKMHSASLCKLAPSLLLEEGEEERKAALTVYSTSAGRCPSHCTEKEEDEACSFLMCAAEIRNSCILLGIEEEVEEEEVDDKDDEDDEDKDEEVEEKEEEEVVRAVVSPKQT